MKQQFFKDTADTFRTYVYENNRKVVPASAAITVYRPGTSEMLVDNVSMTIAPNGLLSFDLGVGQNAVAGSNYKAVVSYDHNGRTWSVTLFYDVVKSRLVKVITDTDIVTELPQLKDAGWKVRGVAESGAVNAIIDSELTMYDDDYFTGGLAFSIDKDETREVTGFTSTTGTVDTTDFSAPITTDRYILTRSYTREIQRAFEKIEERLERMGRRPHLILDPYDLRELHICFSVAEVCKGLVSSPDDVWWELWKEYERRGEEIFSHMNFKYDSSGDGTLVGIESASRVRVLKPVRR